MKRLKLILEDTGETLNWRHYMMKTPIRSITILVSITFFYVFVLPSACFAEEISVECGGSAVKLVCDKYDLDDRCINSFVEVKRGSLSNKIKKKGVVIPYALLCASGVVNKTYIIIYYTDCVVCEYSKYADIYTENGDAMTDGGKHLDTIIDNLMIKVRAEDILRLRR